MIDIKNKTGIVLPGGGVKALESQGAMIQCLVDNGIIPQFAYCCSGGALTGAVYFSGNNFLNFCKSINISNFLKMNNHMSILFGKEVFSTEGIENTLYEMMGDSVFRDMVVNMTDIETHETYYSFGSRSSVIASMSIPKVFPKKTITGILYQNATPFEYNLPMKSVKRQIFVKDREVYDGGVYNLFPMPDYSDIASAGDIYVLVPPASSSPSEMEANSHIVQAVNWISEITERGFRQCLPAYGSMKNIFIIRPAPMDTPFLDWSEDFCLYAHCYSSMENVLKNMGRLKK